jgi:hypothetical protein
MERGSPPLADNDGAWLHSNAGEGWVREGVVLSQVHPKVVLPWEAPELQPLPVSADSVGR